MTGARLAAGFLSAAAGAAVAGWPGAAAPAAVAAACSAALAPVVADSGFTAVAVANLTAVSVARNALLVGLAFVACGAVLWRIDMRAGARR